MVHDVRVPGSGSPAGGFYRLKYHRENGSHRLFLALFLCHGPSVGGHGAERVRRLALSSTLRARRSPGATVAIEIGGKAGSDRRDRPDGRFSLEEPTAQERGCARPCQRLCGIGGAAELRGHSTADHPLSASADRIGDGYRVARRGWRRHGGQLDDRVVGRAPDVGRRRRRRRAAQHAGLQPVSPLVVSRRQPDDPGRDAAGRVRLRCQPHARRCRRLGAQRSVRQLGLLESHSARGRRPHRGRARRRPGISTVPTRSAASSRC